MFRYLERSENIARLVDAGLRMALTGPSNARDEWSSVIDTAAVREEYLKQHQDFGSKGVVDYLLRDRSNPSSVMSSITTARNNARLVRTALTREVWEATNECWIVLGELLSKPIAERELPDVLSTIRRQNAQVRGALHGTMLRNDIFNFCRLGTFLERADNTARILDVKYYVLLPSASQVGSSLDNVQWDTILRSVSGQRAYRMMHGPDVDTRNIVHFLVFDPRMPRSLTFCFNKIADNLRHLTIGDDLPRPCLDLIDHQVAWLNGYTVEKVFDRGLHEFLEEYKQRSNSLGLQIEKDYRFYQ